MRLTLPSTDAVLEKTLKSKLRSQIRKANEYSLRSPGDITICSMTSIESSLATCAIWELPSSVDDCLNRFSMPLAKRPSYVWFDDPAKQSPRHCSFIKTASPKSPVPVASENSISRTPTFGCIDISWGAPSSVVITSSILVEAAKVVEPIDSKSKGGAQPHPAMWQYYVRSGSVDDMRPDSPNKQRLIQAWKRLPVFVTRCWAPRSSVHPLKQFAPIAPA